MNRLEKYLRENVATVVTLWFPALMLLALLAACGNPEVGQ